MLDYEMVHIATSPIFTFAIYKLFHSFFVGQVHNKQVELLSYCGYTILLSAIIFITRVPLIMLMFNVIFLFIISFNYQSSIQKKIVATSFIYSILLLVEIIVSVGIGFLDISIYNDSSFESIVGLILIRTITMIVAYLLSRYKNSNNNNFSLPPLYYLAFTIILFGTLYLFTTSLENDNLTIYNVLLSGTILIIVNVTMIIIDERIYNALILANEKNILKQQNIAYENQAEIISQSMESIKSIRHDMKNHLIMLSEMYRNNKSGEAETYIEDIIDEIDNGGFSKSNNFVIDSIINFKLRTLLGTNTKITVNINVPQQINIFAYDLTVILGNLLDNAITAVLKSKNKKLDLQISCNMGNLIILIDNSYDGKIIIENGQLKTTKTLNSNHGIGLINIEKSLANYDGEMRTEYTTEMFSVAVIIPYEN